MDKQDYIGLHSFPDVQRALLGLNRNIQTSSKTLLQVNNEIDNFLSVTLKDLKEQIDGKITTWYYSGEPTLNNNPANEWKIEQYEEHLGDLYYDKSTGYCYLFQHNTEYNWLKVTDTDTVQALALANAAKDTADSKRQVFLSTPTTPYSNGDLWINNKEIYYCQVSRSSGNYVDTDWTNNLKYTDDTYAKGVDTDLINFKKNVNTIVSGLQTQIDGKCETWFYNGFPTLTNEPALNWTDDLTKSEHLGDLYYDKSTGYSYIFELSNSSYLWNRVKDSDIDGALAIANTAQDTADNKRRIFTTEPKAPYDIGDLWINNNEIYICTTANETSYVSTNWINSLKYTDDTIAKAIITELGGEKTTVLQGTIIEKTNKWVKFTDLSTNGSTTIAGENISTGSIQSNNYETDKTGTKINLTDGTIDTKNFKVDSNGVLKIDKLYTSQGTLSVLNFYSLGNLYGNSFLGYSKLGFDLSYDNNGNANGWKKDIALFNVIIPKDFTIEKIYLYLVHTPVTWNFVEEGTSTSTTQVGYARQLSLYKNVPTSFYGVDGSTEVHSNSTNLLVSEVSNWNPNDSSITKQTFSIPKSYFEEGTNEFQLQSDYNMSTAYISRNGYMYSGGVCGIISIYGFYNY